MYYKASINLVISMNTKEKQGRKPRSCKQEKVEERKDGEENYTKINKKEEKIEEQKARKRGMKDRNY